MPVINVAELSNDEIRVRLAELGDNVGPITDAVRGVYERKLLRLLTGTDQNKPHDDAERSAKDVNSVALETAYSGLSSANEDDQRTARQESAGTGGGGVGSDRAASWPVCLYAVSVPTDAEIDQDLQPPDSRIFCDKAEALKIVKKIKGSRFKQFRLRTDAEAFAVTPADTICPPSPACKLPASAGAELLPPPSEASAFKGPKIQELVRLRKAIEKDDLDTVKSLVWGNPRYLVSSGDTPTLLQEGFRYNSLHVAAMKNKPVICSYLLSTLDDTEFLQLLYPADTMKTSAQRRDFLTDLYLNMPDKGNNESALHFACKFGNADVVQVLVARPETDRFVRNKNGDTPKQVACTRAGDEATKRKIEDLLEGLFYVPLLRSDDNSTQAMIGQPVSPKVPSNQSNRRTQNHVNPCEPVMNVKAYAGPMTPAQANKFRHHWTTPPEQTREFKQIRCTDNDKGLERIGRNIAVNMKVPWCEYWEFLDAFVDLTCNSGLEKLESYLAERDPTWKPPRKTSNDCQSPESGSEAAEGEHDSSLDNLLTSLAACKLNESDRSREGEKLLPHVHPSPSSDDSVQKNFYNTENSLLNSSPGSSDDEEYVTADEDSDSDEEQRSKLRDKNTRMSRQPDSKRGVKASEDIPTDIPQHHTTTREPHDLESEPKTPFSSHIVRLEERLNQLDSSLGCSPTQQKKPITSTSLGSYRSQDRHAIDKAEDKVFERLNSNSKMDQSYRSSSSGDIVETYDSTDLTSRYRQYRDEQRSSILSSPDEKSLSDFSDSSVTSHPGELFRDSPVQPLGRSHIMQFSTPVLQQKKNMYIKGDHPTKLDIDVLRTIESVTLAAEKFPHIARWRRLVTSYSEQDRNSWPSPTANKLLSRKASTPVRNPWLLAPPTFSPLSRSTDLVSRSPYTMSASPIFKPVQFTLKTEEDQQNNEIDLNDSLLN